MGKYVENHKRFIVTIKGTGQQMMLTPEHLVQPSGPAMLTAKPSLLEVRSHSAGSLVDEEPPDPKTPGGSSMMQKCMEFESQYSYTSQESQEPDNPPQMVRGFLYARSTLHATARVHPLQSAIQCNLPCRTRISTPSRGSVRGQEERPGDRATGSN